MTTKREFRRKQRGAFRAGLMMSGAIALAGTALAQGPPTWQGGVSGSPNPGALMLEKKMLVGTCYSNFDGSYDASMAEGYVLAAFDTRDPKGKAGAVAGQLWATESVNGYTSHLNEVYSYHHDHWRAKRLGEIYGVAVSESNSPDIFVSTTNTYNDSGIGVWDRMLAPNTSLVGADRPNGRVYRIDGGTGDAVDVVSLNPGMAAGQNTIAELGNLCWHQSDDGGEWLYVSNLNDGLIYRLDANNLQSANLTFDHGVLGRPNEGLAVVNDDPISEYTAFGRRIWAVQVRKSDSRLYYGVWNASGTDHEIWSVGIDPADGSFQSGTSQREIILSNGSSSPPASIDFGGDDSSILIAEKGSVHDSSLLEYVQVGGTWAPSGVNGNGEYIVGNGAKATNSAGGVKQDCEGNIWVSGNYHVWNGAANAQRVYGASQIPVGIDYTSNPSDVNGTSNLWLDYNNDGSDGNKTAVGALAMYDPCACAEVVDTGFQFFEEADPVGIVDLKLTNTSATGATWVSIIPGDGLDEVCIDGQSDSEGRARVELDAELTMGEEFFLDGVTLKGAEPGEEVCFRVVLFDIDNQTCCSEEICVTMPECFDWKVLGEPEVIEISDSGLATVKLCLEVRNLAEYSFYEWQILENFGAEVEDFVDFPFGTREELKITLPGVPAGGQYSFTLVMHSENYEECCSRTVTVEIPSGTDPSDVGWDMALDDSVCCRGDEVAFANLSLVNNRNEETDLYAVLQEKPRDSDCEQLPLERVQFPGRDLEGNLVKFPVSAGAVVEQEIQIDCTGLDFANGVCYEFCISVTDGTGTQRTECIRIEPCLEEDTPIGAGTIGLVGVEVGTPVPFDFDFTNNSDEEVIFVWDVEAPIEGVVIEGVNGFNPGQELTLAAGEVLNIELQANLENGTLENYPWLSQVFSFITVTAELGDALGRRSILEIPMIVRALPGSEELVCVHSFESVADSDLMKLTVSVMAPNSVLTVQQMELDTEVWNDVAFGTTPELAEEFDSLVLGVGTYEFLLQKNEVPRALYRVVCTQ